MYYISFKYAVNAPLCLWFAPLIVSNVILSQSAQSIPTVEMRAIHPVRGKPIRRPFNETLEK